MVSISSDLGNADQNYNEITSHPFRWLLLKKKKKVHSVKNIIAVLQKIKHRITK